MRWPLTVVPTLIVICLFDRAAESQSPATLLIRNGRLIDGTGGKGDLVVFDAASIADRGTPQDPALSPVGIDTVIGQIVLASGAPTGARPGRALRRQSGSHSSWR
jgi:N-acyl-D-aspartate/D-glutamate deacylase